MTIRVTSHVNPGVSLPSPFAGWLENGKTRDFEVEPVSAFHSAAVRELVHKGHIGITYNPTTADEFVEMLGGSAAPRRYLNHHLVGCGAISGATANFNNLSLNALSGYGWVGGALFSWGEEQLGLIDYHAVVVDKAGVSLAAPGAFSAFIGASMKVLIVLVAYKDPILGTAGYAGIAGDPTGGAAADDVPTDAEIAAILGTSLFLRFINVQEFSNAGSAFDHEILANFTTSQDYPGVA